MQETQLKLPLHLFYPYSNFAVKEKNETHGAFPAFAKHGTIISNLGIFAACVMLATILHFLIEKPFQNLKNKIQISQIPLGAAATILLFLTGLIIICSPYS